jgi:hypothetical protein
MDGDRPFRLQKSDERASGERGWCAGGQAEIERGTWRDGANLYRIASFGQNGTPCARTGNESHHTHPVAGRAVLGALGLIRLPRRRHPMLARIVKDDDRFAIDVNLVQRHPCGGEGHRRDEQAGHQPDVAARQSRRSHGQLQRVLQIGLGLGA